MIGKKDINIIAVTVTATTPDYRGLAQCLLDEIAEARKDPEYMAEYEKWKGGDKNGILRTFASPVAG